MKLIHDRSATRHNPDPDPLPKHKVIRDVRHNNKSPEASDIPAIRAAQVLLDGIERHLGCAVVPGTSQRERDDALSAAIKKMDKARELIGSIRRAGRKRPSKIGAEAREARLRGVDVFKTGELEV